jgi:hypothetical protein
MVPWVVSRSGDDSKHSQGTQALQAQRVMRPHLWRRPLPRPLGQAKAPQHWRTGRWAATVLAATLRSSMRLSTSHDHAFTDDVGYRMSPLVLCDYLAKNGGILRQFCLPWTWSDEICPLRRSTMAFWHTSRTMARTRSANVTPQHCVAICGDPDDVEVDRTGGVGTMAIVTHAPQSTNWLRVFQIDIIS